MLVEESEGCENIVDCTTLSVLLTCHHAVRQDIHQLTIHIFSQFPLGWVRTLGR